MCNPRLRDKTHESESNVFDEADMLEPEESTLLIRRPKEFGSPSESGIASLPPSDDERERFIRALELCGGNQTRAAQMLGVSRRTLINRLDRWKLPRPQKR